MSINNNTKSKWKNFTAVKIYLSINNELTKYSVKHFIGLCLNIAHVYGLGIKKPLLPVSVCNY